MAQKSPLEITIIAVLLTLATLVLVRVLAPFRFALLAFFGIAIIGGLIYVVVQYFNNKKYSRSIEGSLEQRMMNSEAEIAKLKQEISELIGNTTELKQQLNGTQLSPPTRAETERLLREFEQEISLRETKIQFFKTTLQKLKYLLDNHRQTLVLEAKQARLKELRSNQHEELAQLETIKANLEQDQQQLENIETLTLKILKSDTLDGAEEVQRELVRLTRN